jgi:hypothetical protein
MSTRAQRPASPEATNACASAADEQLAQIHDAGLALVGGHEVGQLGPPGDERVARRGIALDVRRRRQRDRHAGAGRADRPQHGRARLGGQRLGAVRLVGVDVHDAGARVGRRARGRRDRRRRPRHRGVLVVGARSVQAGLDQEHARQRRRPVLRSSAAATTRR